MLQPSMANDIKLTTGDGFTLAATHYAAAGESFVVMAGATGVPRGFYRRFAGYLAERGVNVLTFDFRGVGESAPASLRGFDASFIEWGRHDLAAAVSWVAARGPAYLVGHSFGGHAIGMLPDPHQLQAAYVCGAGAGWHGWMPPFERVKVRLLWNVIAPVTTSAYGYLPMRHFGKGENLPLGVYRQWRRWCSYQHYFFDDPEARELTAPYADVRLPIAAATATDDLWAPPASRDAFMQGYRRAAVDGIDLSPRDLGVKSVGHMGYFRPHVGETLWPQIAAWLQTRGMRMSGEPA